jgi:predicted ATPase
LKTKRIVITGGPGTGKTALIEYLIGLGYNCLPEISRAVTKKAQADGIDQLFLEQPILFSEMLLEGRLSQYNEAKSATAPFLFYDRGMPDITSYMDYLGTTYSKKFTEICKANIYDAVFLLPPWKEIYKQDNERYESFKEAELLFVFLQKGYESCGYNVIHVPFETLENRTNFILKKLKELS